MKKPKLNELRERVTLYTVTYKTDAELNRVEYLKAIKTVWANVSVKSTSYSDTDTGNRPEERYEVMIRRTDTEFQYIGWRGKVYALRAPKYDFEYKYTVFEMVANYGEKAITAEFPEGRKLES